MRPLRLELSAFRSYASASVDWSGYDLVVIDGPTGAGKTSLLDAIAFALYGRTPTAGRPGELLSLGSDHGEVRLSFSVRGDTWRATRRLGPAAPEPLHVLERLDSTGAAIAVDVGEAVVDDAIERLLGMSFSAFTSAVLLAQGRFDQFLRSRPAERDRILRELFGVESLEAARLAAEGARGGAEAQAQVLRDERERLPPHGGRALAAAASAARVRAREVARLRAAAPLAEALVAGRETLRAADAESQAISEALATIPDPAAREEIRRALAAAGAAREEAAARTERAQEALAAARARHDEELERVGATAAELGALEETAARLADVDREIPHLEEQREERALEHDSAQRRVRRAARASEAASRRAAGAAEASHRRRQLGDAEASCRRAREDLARARAHAATSGEERRRAEAAREDAAAAFEHARRDHEAAHLRATLSAGDPCPVCGSVVGLALPDGGDADLEGLRERLAERTAGAEAAARADSESRAAVTAAQGVLRASEDAARVAHAALEQDGDGGRDESARADRLRGRAETAARFLGAAEAALSSSDAQLAARRGERATLADRLGRWADVPDVSGAIAVAKRRLAAVAAGLAGAQGGADSAARELDAAREHAKRLDAEVHQPLRTALAGLEHALGLRSGLTSSWTATLDAADHLVQAGAERHASLATTLSAASASLERAESQLRALDADSRPPTVLRAGLAAALADRDTSRSEWMRRVAAAADAHRLDARERTVAADAARHGQIARDLRADRFPRFLLQRYRTRLAVAASGRLHELSAGRFRFACREPDPLAVVDLARGERTRGAATLSGGEGFVASLALALGLGDVASAAGGRLECLFLDEGFSTLDADSLETALTAVERLGGGGRLVGVITHLPGVAERLGAAIHIARDPDGRSRVIDERSAA